MGKSAKTIGIIVAVVLVLFVIRVGLSMAKRPDDRQLIQNALKEAIQASKDGKPGGVMELLSRNLKVNDQNVGGNTRDIADFVRRQRPGIEVLEPEAQITGAEGRIVSPVTLDLGLLGQRTIKEVTMKFRKEDATEYLVIPVTKWRLVEVEVPETSIADLVTGG